MIGGVRWYWVKYRCWAEVYTVKMVRVWVRGSNRCLERISLSNRCTQNPIRWHLAIWLRKGKSRTPLSLQWHDGIMSQGCFMLIDSANLIFNIGIWSLKQRGSLIKTKTSYKIIRYLSNEIYVSFAIVIKLVKSVWDNVEKGVAWSWNLSHCRFANN